MILITLFDRKIFRDYFLKFYFFRHPTDHIIKNQCIILKTSSFNKSAIDVPEHTPLLSNVHHIAVFQI